ncbi:MAG TPA: MFS transporter [Steroidobacteraceae bacterium]|nr:MFS transporter [Steroidobacteraceae bacterium]
MAQLRSAEQLAVAGGSRGALTPSVSERPTSLAAEIAWAICDGARNPYNVLVNIFVFAAYFTTVVIPDPVRGQTVWSYVSAAAALSVALTAPVLGAIADAGGRRKPWLLGCLALGAPCMAMLWFATPGMGHGLAWIMLALIGGTLCFEYSGVFTSAMLPTITSARRISFLSGLGFSLANFSGIILFTFYLLAWDRNPHPLFGLDVRAHEPERAVGILAALWMVVFYLPMFFLTPDVASTSCGAREAVRRGIASLIETLSRVRSYRNAATYLAARLIYNEGFMVMMLFTSVVAAGVLHWTPRMLIAMGLVNSVIATAAGLFAGWLDRRIGTKRAVIVFVAGCLAANVAVCSITPQSVFFVTLSHASTPGTGLFPTLPDKVFLVTQNFIALFVTGGLVTSRTLMAKLSPPTMLNEFFGLYALSGNATSFMGPLAIGIVTAAFANQRAGVAVGIGFLAVGLILMLPVRDPRPPAPLTGP